MLEQFGVPMGKILCSIIIPVYNNAKVTMSALRDLSKLPSDKYEIIIVNNGSEDDTEELVSEFIKGSDSRIILINNTKNLYFAGANNHGYKYSNGEYILFLNNDIRVDKDHETWPMALIDAAKDGSLVGTQGGLLDEKFNFVKEGYCLPQSQNWYLSGWCVCAKRETFAKLIPNHFRDHGDGQLKEGKAYGPWDERFEFYFEDAHMSFMAKQLGIPFKEVNIPVVHYGRVTAKKVGMPYLYNRGRRLFKKIWLK